MGGWAEPVRRAVNPVANTIYVANQTSKSTMLLSSGNSTFREGEILRALLQLRVAKSFKTGGECGIQLHSHLRPQLVIHKYKYLDYRFMPTSI